MGKLREGWSYALPCMAGWESLPGGFTGVYLVGSLLLHHPLSLNIYLFLGLSSVRLRTAGWCCGKVRKAACQGFGTQRLEKRNTFSSDIPSRVTSTNCSALKKRL